MRVDGAAQSGEHALRGRDDGVGIRIRHGRAQEPMVGRAHQNALGQHALDEMPDHAVADIRSGGVEPYERRGREADSPVTQIYYDGLGRQVAVMDANGHINAQMWDGGGHLMEELHADGGVVVHNYDTFGDEVLLADALGNVTQYGYDHLGRKTSITSAPVAVYTVGTDNSVSGTTTSWSPRRRMTRPGTSSRRPTARVRSRGTPTTCAATWSA